MDVLKFDNLISNSFWIVGNLEDSIKILFSFILGLLQLILLTELYFGDCVSSSTILQKLVDKNPSKAISLFWAAINSGDRVDSALKDMAFVMRQLNRSDEAIEAIKSFRHLCPKESQESLDNVLIDLYKVRTGHECFFIVI